MEEKNNNYDTEDNTNNINTEIKRYELDLVLSQLNNSSPGPDYIPNVMIKQLTDKALKYLLAIYNFIWKRQEFPDTWREATVIPILKPDKVPSSPSNYRPISLTCNMCKIMEKIISRRIRWYLEAHNILAPLQFGFRESHSTMDYLINVEAEICEAFLNKSHVIAVAIDIEKAYEMVWKHRVLKIIENLNLKGNILAFIKNFLSNRSIRVRINKTLSKPVQIENGLPQGSVLSVILFLISINEVLQTIHKPVKGFLFADDLTIICTGKNIQHTARLIQNTLNNLQKWSDNTGFKFSKTKTEYIIFSRKKEEKRVTLKLDDNIIRSVPAIKILGMTFDSKMKWKIHIEKLRTECFRRINTIKALSALQWGSDRKCLIQTYQAIIRSKLDYGCILYDSAGRDLINKLETIQNTALRLCIGAFRTSPTISILVETNMIPLKLRRKEQIILYANKMLVNNQNTHKYPWKRNTTEAEYLAHPGLPKPLYIRASLYTKELNMTIPSLLPKKKPTLPPWNNITIKVNMDLAVYEKSTTPKGIFRSLFLEMKTKYDDYKSYYTDGSAMNGRRGCAIVTNNKTYRFRLHDTLSIYTCEAIAIFQSLQIIRNNRIETKHVIFSDSKSALLAITNTNNSNLLIKEIRELITWLITNNYTIELVWIPSHQGIQGNEEADKEAKNAINEPLNNTIRSPQEEVKRYIKIKIKEFWDSHWRNIDSNKLQEIIQSTFEKSVIVPTSRREQVTIARLRIGHTNLTHIHLITKKQRNLCEKCGEAWTVKHLLVYCQELKTERDQSELPKSIRDCLNTKVGCRQTIVFLKLINKYNSI